MVHVGLLKASEVDFDLLTCAALAVYGGLRYVYLMLTAGYCARACLCIRVSLCASQPQQEHKPPTVSEMRLFDFLFVSPLLEGLFISGKVSACLCVCVYVCVGVCVHV